MKIPSLRIYRSGVIAARSPLTLAAILALTNMMAQGASGASFLAHVVPIDASAPVALSTCAPAANFVSVTFDRPLDPATGADSTRYQLNDGASVNSAMLVSGNQIVVLGVTGLTTPAYTLAYSNIGDMHGNFAAGSIEGANNTGLTLMDIGAATLPGYIYRANSDAMVVAATGSDIWTGADGFTYLFRTLTGDFDMRVRVEYIINGNGNTRGGLMVREDETEGSRNIAALTYFNAANWVATARTTINDATIIPGYPGAGLVGRDSPYPNAWLRIARAGQTFNTYYSANGFDWLPLDGGGITPSEPFAETLLVGIASCQVNPGASSYSVFTYSGFQNFVASEGTIVITAQPTNVTVLENRPATFSISATLQGGDSSGLRYQWRTNDVDIPGAASPRFAIATPSRALTGTHVDCVVSAGPTIAPASSTVAILTITPDTNGPAVALVSASALAPTMATVVFDERLDASTANDASRYALDGGFTVLSAELQPDGMTVRLGMDGLSAPQFQIVCTDITDLAGNPSAHTISSTLNNAGLSLLDIQGANPAISTLVSSTPTGMTLQSQFGDIWSTIDSCSFVYQLMTNDFDVRLQIVSMAVDGGYGRGGLMARSSSDPDSANIMVGSYREGFGMHIWTERAVQGGDTTFGTAPQDPGFPNVWSRLQRTGSTFIAYHSSDGIHWTQFGLMTDLAAPEIMFVGMAFSTCVLDNSLVGTVQFDQYGPTPLIPQIQITKSAGNVVISWPAEARNYQLQQTSQLGLGASWSSVADTPVQQDNWLRVMRPIDGSCYYRLAD